MSQEYVQWTQTAKAHHHVTTELDIQNNEQVLLFTCYADEPPEPRPPIEPISGIIVAGDLTFDTDIQAWVLKDVQIEPLA